MRRPLFAANWKMNTTSRAAVQLVKKLKKLVCAVNDRDLLVCPPFTALSEVWAVLRESCIMVGAQNVFWEEKGAFTGEISARMLKSVGATYVIIGHSERRQYFGETDETVNKRLKTALKHNLIPIICVGETLEQHEKNETFQIIERQVRGGLQSLDIGHPSTSLGMEMASLSSHWSLVIAYEPVWAIGTGKTATPEQAQEVHAFIRNQLAEFFDQEAADQIRILYGGSVTSDNIKALMAQPDIDGGLVGGASLKADSFAKIIKY